MDELLKELEQYRLPEEDEKRVKKIRALCLEMNWDEIRNLAEQAIS